MANTIDFILTNSAAELMQKVISGKTLNFTRMAVGDGFSYDPEIAKGFTTLVNEVLSLDITKQETLSPSSVKFTSAFKNTDAQKEFYYREVGLYAQDPDTGKEVLYAYGNRNDAAELIIPTGANVVNKQLVFIISVGNSANVTFNVNADVYALQEDMLDVQANKANKNLANTGMITNCLLEVPQDIKLNLLNGTLTLLAGSKVYIPNGFEADGITKKFIINTLSNDIIFTVASSIGTHLIGTYNTTGTYRVLPSVIYSQNNEPTAPEDWGLWYDTTNNIIKRFYNGTWNEGGYSLPIGLSTWENGLCTSIDQIFNGMGYIGSTVFVLPGVKGLMPNGRNPDGTLNNIEYTVPNIAFKDCSNSNHTNINFFVNIEGKLGHNFFFESETIISKSDVKTYIPSRNKIYSNNSIVQKELYVAKGTIENKKIISLKPYTTIRPVDKSNDKQWLASLSLPSNEYKNIELKATGSNYTAPTNGWYAIRKVVGIASAGVSCAVYDETGTTEIYRQTSKNSVAEDEVAMIIPILKRQVLQVSYDATGETKYFRFIYAQGEVN